MGSGERLNGIQEVSGSIPLISTRKSLETDGFQGSLFIPAAAQINDRLPLAERAAPELRRAAPAAGGIGHHRVGLP